MVNMLWEETNPFNSLKETSKALQAIKQESEFTLVNKTDKGRKKPNPTLAFYINAAAVATGTKQPTPPKTTTQLPMITDVTVIQSRSEGHMDAHMEMSIRARGVDSIAWKVHLKIKTVVANLI